MKGLILISAIFFCSIGVITSQDKINWMSWEDAVELQKENGKKVFVDIYTNWCGWCKKMDKTTFAHPVIIKYINENFIPVKLNAEQRETINYDGKEYKYVKGGRRGVHELAYAITSGKLSYPTYVFMDEQMRVIQPVPGYQPLEQFEYVMNFFGGDYYLSEGWESFQESFESKI